MRGLAGHCRAERNDHAVLSYINLGKGIKCFPRLRVVPCRVEFAVLINICRRYSLAEKRRGSPSVWLEASYRHFFIGQVSGSSRSRFHCLSTGFKNYHSEASRHLKSRRIELSSTRAPLLMRRFLWRTNFQQNRGLQSTTCNR